MKALKANFLEMCAILSLTVSIEESGALASQAMAGNPKRESEDRKQAPSKPQAGDRTIQGVWEVVSRELLLPPLPPNYAGGGAGPAFGEGAKRWFMADGKIVMKIGDRIEESRFTVDRTQNPMSIDIAIVHEPFQDAGTAQGIYRTSDDSLAICYGMPQKSRPKEFRGGPHVKDILYLFSLKRDLATQDDFRRLQGTWVAQSRRGNASAKAKDRLVFNGNDFTRKQGGKTLMAGRFMIDPDKERKALLTMRTDRKLLTGGDAVGGYHQYELARNTLTIRYDVTDRGGPIHFKGKETVVVYRRGSAKNKAVANE